MLELIVPWCLLLLSIGLLYLLVKKKWIFSGIIVLLILFINSRFECIPFRLSLFKDTYSEFGFRVMCFNLDGIVDGAEKKIPEIAEVIKQQNPDVVFLLEFREIDKFLLDTLLGNSYPYSSYYSSTGHGFYSKHHLSALRVLDNEKQHYDIFATSFCIGKDSISLYGCHLASNNFTSNMDYLHPDAINNHNDLMIYLEDITLASKRRENEAEVIAKDIKGKNYIIVMGDFNDVGGSKPLRLLEERSLKDAWWKGGVGYGATINKPIPYRIDHILFGDGLKLTGIKRMKTRHLSDHDALSADFVIIQ